MRVCAHLPLAVHRNWRNEAKYGIQLLFYFRGQDHFVSMTDIDDHNAINSTRTLGFGSDFNDILQ